MANCVSMCIIYKCVWCDYGLDVFNDKTRRAPNTNTTTTTTTPHDGLRLRRPQTIRTHTRTNRAATTLYRKAITSFMLPRVVPIYICGLPPIRLYTRSMRGCAGQTSCGAPKYIHIVVSGYELIATNRLTVNMTLGRADCWCGILRPNPLSYKLRQNKRKYP